MVKLNSLRYCYDNKSSNIFECAKKYLPLLRMSTTQIDKVIEVYIDALKFKIFFKLYWLNCSSQTI